MCTKPHNLFNAIEKKTIDFSIGKRNRLLVKANTPIKGIYFFRIKKSFKLSLIMGAKTSTANGANGATSSGPHHQHHVHSQQHNSQNPRTRTFSSSSSSATEVLPGGSSTSATTTGFSLLRSIPGMHVTAANQSTIDRQRARSLSSVPDLQQSNGNGTTQSNYLNGNLFLFLFIWTLSLFVRAQNTINFLFICILIDIEFAFFHSIPFHFICGCYPK